MKERLQKKYAAFICLLVFLSDCRARPDYSIKEDFFVDQNEDEFVEKQLSNDDVPEQVHYDRIKDEAKALAVSIPKQKNSKRYIAVILLIATAATAALDIYKAVAGCDDFGGPTIEKNVKRAKVLKKEFEEERNQLNLDWATVEGRKRYLSSLESLMKTAKIQITRMDTLKSSIVQLLDSDILTKFEYVKANVTNMLLAANETNYVDPNVYRDQVISQSALATTLSVKLVPLALWIGFSGIPTLIRKYAEKYADKSSKTIAQKMAVKANKWAKAKYKKVFKIWNKAVANLPVWSWVKNKLTKDLKTMGTTATKVTSVKTKVIKGVGAAVGVAFLAAMEVVSFLNHKESCETRLKKSTTLVNDLLESKKNMTYVRGNLTEIRVGVESSYALGFGYFKSKDVADFVKRAIETAKGAETQTQLLKDSVKEMEYFLKTINTTWNLNGYIDYYKADKAIKVLIDGFLKMNFKLICVKQKLQVLAAMRGKCAGGTASMKQIWNESLSTQGDDLKDCMDNQKYLTKARVWQTISGEMKALGLSSICMRNNKEKLSLVCKQWLNDVSNKDISDSDKEITLDDVKYFVSKCPLGSVTNLLASRICELKKNSNMTLEKVLSTYHKYKPEEIQATWRGCKLDSEQIKAICDAKGAGFTYAVIMKGYSNYPPSELKATFANCVFKLDNDMEKSIVCSMYKFAAGNLKDEMLKSYVDKYGEKQVKDHGTSQECKDQPYRKK